MNIPNSFTIWSQVIRILKILYNNSSQAPKSTLAGCLARDRDILGRFSEPKMNQPESLQVSRGLYQTSPIDK